MSKHEKGLGSSLGPKKEEKMSSVLSLSSQFFLLRYYVVPAARNKIFLALLVQLLGFKQVLFGGMRLSHLQKFL